ncbi:MAG: hypothetical protein IJZ78_02815 [Alistipes sp.]|nr:hypothetical protein [Alistipes sp.]
MRKFFTTLKSVVAASVIAAMTLAASCSTEYNDQPLNDRLDKVEKDLTALTERVAALEKKLGDEVEALKTLIDGKTVVTEVTTDADGNTVIKLSDGKEITVLAGCDCEPATPCTCDPLEYRVVDGVLEVSADGENWIPVQVAPECVVAEVTVNDDNTVTITLANGEEFTVVKAELIEFNTTRGQLYVKAGETKEISFTVNDAVADINVMNQPLGWKATVEAAVADEEAAEGDENVDPGMGILAAGGTEFVLKITGPSQELVDAGIAEETGFISVHFNSEAGACKVGKIAVEMAKITLDVDKAGMVTVTSTMVDTYLYSSWEGDQMITEFNNYYVAVMDIADYNDDLASIYNSSWWEFTVPHVGGWINNFYYNVNTEYNTTDKGTYREGENEKWTFQAPLADIIKVLDWGGTLSYEGNSFMVLVIPTDPQEYGALLLDQALAAPFKQVNVKAEVVETTWNDALLNATLRGANAYQFNIENKATLDYQLEQGWYGDGATYDDYYRDYIFYWQNYGSSFGSHRVTQDVVAEGISFNELINYGEEYPYLYELAPNTTYIVAILAEEDGKTEYSPEDLIRFEFTTADVVEAATPFEYTIVRDDEQTDYFRIFANVTVPETAVAVYSVWESEEIMEDVKGHLIENGWVKNDFSQGYTYELNTTVNAAGDEKILYIMIVDAEGNYSIGQQTLASKEVVVNENVNLTIENVEFLTEENGGVANITLGGLEGVEYSYIKAYVCSTDGNSYYLRSEEDLQDLAYGTDYLYVQYDTNPFKVTRTGDYKYQATEGKTYIVAVAVNFADGTVSKTVCGEFTFDEAAPEEPATPDYEVTFTAVEYLGEATDYYTTYSQFKFTNEAGNWMILAMHPADVVDGLLPVGEFPINWTDQGEVYGNATTISKELFTSMTYDPYITEGKVVISKDGDVYTVVVNGENLYLDGESGKTLKATFEGTIAAAGGDDSGNEGGDVTVVSAVAGAHDDFVGETLVTFTLSDDSTFAIAFKTGDYNYLTPGIWQGNSYSDPNYITYIYRNDVTISSYTEVEVSYADGAYTIGAFQSYNYDTGSLENFPGYTGAIEGLDAPAE